MNRRRFLSLLLLLVVFGGGLLFLWKAIGASSSGAETTSSAEIDRPAKDAAASATLDAPVDIGAAEHERTSSVANASVTGAERDENFALDDARWIEGSVRAPSGAPNDDTLAVWAVATTDPGTPKVVVSGALDSGSVVARLRREKLAVSWSRRAVDADARFKVPVPKSAPNVWLVVDGRYLYLAGARRLDEHDLASPIVLAPALGACLSMTCRSPAAASSEDRAAPASVRIDGFSMGQGRGRARVGYVQRELDLALDAAFELRALPLELRYTLMVSPKRLATATKSELALAAGKTTEITLDLKLGARVSGHVFDEQHAPVAGVKVASDARANGLFFGNASDDRAATTDADGAYELYGLRGGKQRLDATMENWADSRSDELTLADEQRLTGVDIVLSHGATISGHVGLPDGSPAKTAAVQAIDASEKRQRWGAGRVRGASADEHGNFAIRGLGQGPFVVTASVHELETTHADDEAGLAKLGFSAQSPSTSSKDSADDRAASADDHDAHAATDAKKAKSAVSARPKKAITLVASREDVKAGTEDLSLVLHPPSGLRGRVVDSTGAALREFTVQVNPDWQSARVAADRGMHEQTFKSDDGSFFVDDVTDGDWKVVVKADAYSQLGDAPSVSVPQTGDPLVIQMVVSATVAGVVLDPSGNPVKDAEVHIAPQGDVNRVRYARDDAAPKSDEKGAFTVKNVAAGAWQLTASSEQWAKSEALPVTVTAGQNLAGVELHVRSGGSILGEVWDARGSRAAGRHVQLMSMSAGDGRQAEVDDAGSFKAEHLTPGAYQVMLEPSEADQASMLEKSGNGEEPDVADIFSKLKMTSCEVKEGEVTRVVLGAPPKAPVKLSGRITQGGEPVTKCTLVVLNEGGAILQSLKFGKVDASGHYELTIDKPGDVVLVVSKEFGRGKGVDFYLSIPEVEQYTADLALPISAIKGSVRGPNGAPLAKFPVQIVRDSAGANIMMMDAAPSATTDELGRFEFPDLNPGTYAVAAGGSSGAFDGDNTSYGRAVRGGLRIEKDRVLEGIDLKLSAPGRISGTVRDASGAPVSSATIYVRDAQGELLSRHSACTSDASGKFVYKGVAPGSYTLGARTHALAARESALVEVREGDTAEIDLALESGTMLRVSAVDKDDKPLKAGISVKDERGFELAGMMSGDAMQEALLQGVSSTEQKIGPLASGKYVVAATTTDGRSAKKAVTLKGQDERKLVVRVE
jgi:hypothetical protein